MGHVPPDVLRAFRAFLDFCYLVRRDVIDEDTLAQIQDALDSFHRYRVVFLFVGVRPNGFSLPRQHSLAHYQHLIRLFGAPNGICTSITESMHRKAIKKPYQRTNRCNALGQVLIVNQRNDHITASRLDFEARGMLKGTVLTLTDAHEGAGSLIKVF